MSQRAVIVLSVLLALVVAAPVRAQADSKVKVKGSKVVVKDKSKPVRKALEDRYDRLAEAVETKDFEAFQALRTADFHTVDEQGRERTAQQMADRARDLLARIQPPIEVRHELGVIDVRGRDATVTVRQHFSKMLDLAGTLRKVESRITQDETWTLTPDGWKLTFVGNERDGETYVDGKRIDPSQPYDPEAPEYEPKEEEAGG